MSAEIGRIWPINLQQGHRVERIWHKALSMYCSLIVGAHENVKQ